jgi:hypothetical protein
MKPHFRLWHLSLLAILAVLAGGWVWQWQRFPADITTVPTSDPGRESRTRVIDGLTLTAVGPRSGAGEVSVAAALHARLLELRQIKTGDNESRERLLRELLALVTEDNVAEMVQSLSAEELDTPFGPAVLERWLAVDVRQAASWMETRSGITDEQVMLLVCYLLGDPAGPHAYYDQLPDTDWRQRVLAQASLERLMEDSREAVALALQMKPGADRQNVLETAVYAWTGREPEAALAWMLRVEDATQRQKLLAVGAVAIGTADPDLGAAWLDLTVPGGGQSEAALCIAELWSEHSPAEAAKWAARLPVSGPRVEVLDLVARRWLQSDPTAANAWLRLLPEHDQLLARLKPVPAEAEEGI